MRFDERILFDGRPIAEAELALVLDLCERANGGAPITFFEITTAAAFVAFARRPADVLLLETGLGGRLDATNVIERPRLTALAPIALDHQAFLGERLEQIAFEKAGILKPGVPCIVGPQDPAALAVIEARAAEIGAPLVVHGRDWQAWRAGERLQVEVRAGAGSTCPCRRCRAATRSTTAALRSPARWRWARWRPPRRRSRPACARSIGRRACSCSTAGRSRVSCRRARSSGSTAGTTRPPARRSPRA